MIIKWMERRAKGYRLAVSHSKISAR